MDDLSLERNLLEIQMFIDLPMLQLGIAAYPYIAVPDMFLLFDIILHT
jgi:hypothetical protein